MSGSPDAAPAGPDLKVGVPATSVADGAILLGHVNDEPVILARTGGSLYAIGATCTHYGGPLAEGILDGDTVRCPWHHACFSLKTGEALLAPALDRVSCFRVEESGRTVFVRDSIEPPSLYRRQLSSPPTSIVIIGAGAAGVAAAEMLRRCGYTGPITMFDELHSAPVDRPNLSKDYLAGTAEEAWVSLRPDDFFSSHDINLVRGERIARIDAGAHSVITESGSVIPYGALLIATGSSPVKLPIPGGDLQTVHYLRTLEDSKSIIAAAQNGKRAVVIGASFIGLEVAAALRERNVAVTVVAPESLPLERVLGPELGRMIQTLHEGHGVTFKLGNGVKSIATDSVELSDGTSLPADFVVIGVGVRPNLSLARDAGIDTDNGVILNATLESSVPNVFAAGDIASWPDPRAGRIRVEHWVVAERQGQFAARNMLGANESFNLPPFFWSRHYDQQINYVGHSSGNDSRKVDGDPMQHDCTVAYTATTGALQAEADVGRDQANLRAAVLLEQSPR